VGQITCAFNHSDRNDRVLRGLPNDPEQRLWFVKGLRRSVGRENCTEAIIERFVLMNPSATSLLLGYCKLFNRTFGPSSTSSHAHFSGRSREDEEPVGGDPRPCTYSCLLIERNTVILGFPDPANDRVPLRDLALPTRPNGPSLTTTSPIKLRRITRSRRSFFIISPSILGSRVYSRDLRIRRYLSLRNNTRSCPRSSVIVVISYHNWTGTVTVCVPHCAGCYKPQPQDTNVVVPSYDDSLMYTDTVHST